MVSQVRIPIKVQPDVHAQVATREHLRPEPAGVPPVAPEQAVEQVQPQDNSQERTVPGGAHGPSLAKPDAGAKEETARWRDQAARLQADMDNYRKRQRRLARDEVNAEQRRLLGSFLQIVDNLERALAAPSEGDGSLREGVELTHRTALKMLEKEGVQPIAAAGRPFDPAWHEAVATQAQGLTDAAPGSVSKVVETGYRLGDELLRPARVIVAV